MRCRLSFHSLLTLLFLSVAPWLNAGENAPQKTVELLSVVRAEDLYNGKAQIIGRLGKPLQQLLIIQGQWRQPTGMTKEPGPHFYITHVNGIELQPEVMLHQPLVDFLQLPGSQKEKPKPKGGEHWLLKGWETGRHLAEPIEVNRLYKTMPVSRPIYFNNFITSIIYTDYKRVTSAAVSVHPGNQQQLEKTIHATNLDGQSQIEGLLGKPLHSLIKIEGKWVGDAVLNNKLRSLHFRVIRVNDKALQIPIDFPQQYVRDGGLLWTHTPPPVPEPQIGKTWIFQGWEAGRFWGVPEEAYGSKKPPHLGKSHGFLTELYYLDHEIIVKPLDPDVNRQLIPTKRSYSSPFETVPNQNSRKDQLSEDPFEIKKTK